MNETKRKSKKPNKSQNQPNNTSIPPKSQAECYAQAWRILFNKLSKDSQEVLTVNLKRDEQVIRGQSRMFPDVRDFVKAVADLGEEIFSKVKPSA